VDRVRKIRIWIAAGLALGMLTFTANVRGQATMSASSLGRPAPAVQRVIFEVRNLRSDNGQVMGALFDSAERWVRTGEETAACRVAIRNRVARCAMEVPVGRYAFAFAHDEDRDGQFDRDFLGIPQEGYGFSNDVRPSLSLPSWQSAAFHVRETPSGRPLVVTTRYGI